MMCRVVMCLVLLAIVCAPRAMAESTEASSHAEPGIEYGKVDDLPLPKTILFSATPEEIAADAEEWKRHGIDAFFMDRVARDWSSDIWAADGKPWTLGAEDEMFQKAKLANDVCRRIGSETFLKIAFDHFFDWFSDTAWNRIDNNFRQFAVFARDTGCTGIALDIEYVGDQYQFEWPGYTYQGYTRADLVRKVQERMTNVIRVLYDTFPDMVFLTFPEGGLRLGTAIHVAWIEEAARRNAPGGVHYCTEYTYRNPNIRYMFGHVWACNEMFHRLLSPEAWEYWTKRGSITEGVWPLGFNYESNHDPGMTYDEFRQGYAASLMVSRCYNWVYSHNSAAQLIGRDLDSYKGRMDYKAYLGVVPAKEMATNPKYVALARELRSMTLRDYSGDLGVVPIAQIKGPYDTPSFVLVPASTFSSEWEHEMWQPALDYYLGHVVDFHKAFGTQTHWMIIGPFPNPGNFEGHNAAYPPEQGIDLNATYDGVSGPVKWTELNQEGPLASVDLAKVLAPSEHVTAYALCYVSCPSERDVQIRIGTNDAGKLWVGGKLAYDHSTEGAAILDRDTVWVTLPKGVTPLLIKVSNGVHDWGFVFRITDDRGVAMSDLTFSTSTPPAPGP